MPTEPDAIDRVAVSQGTDAKRPKQVGLEEAEARRRLTEEGYNELARRQRRSTIAVVLGVMREPMLLLLVAGGIIYLALGDLGEALMLLAFAGFSIGVTALQETRSERSLEALSDLASPRALVLRDGLHRHIPGREVVRGDLVLLGEGDRVPADGWIVENHTLAMDESLLTGESAPVSKARTTEGVAETRPRPGGNGLAYAFSGTLVVRGSGLCRIAATGAQSEIGRIGQSLVLMEVQAPRLYHETRRLVALFAIGAVLISGFAVLLFGLLRGTWLEAALAGIALGMSMMPEEIPVVLAIFLGMGAVRMSRERVLARRGAAIETLGSATVLCTDKTGTITENRMTVAELRLSDGSVFSPDGTPLPHAFVPIAELALLASAPQAVDPMEIAFHDLDRTQRSTRNRKSARADWDLRHRYPLDPGLLAISHVWQTGSAVEDHLIASKGAPEAIAELCRLDGDARASMHVAVDAMAREGLRVLGIAEARWRGSDFPATQRGFKFVFHGLIGLRDPLRASVPGAVKQCRSAGIRVVMITGDYPETARAIARAAGIDEGEVITGTMLAAMDDAELAQRVRRVGVFARIMPEQKLRIVKAFQSAGEVVGMTGDGVNDAPALKAADIGIAMGKRGTDVAREAAAIVLLDDDFGSIATAIRMGRRIYDNLRKAMGFIVAVHIPIAGLALMPLLFGLPILLGPVHIALLQMIIDPVCSLVFEAETDEADVMRRPPRPAGTLLLSRALLGWSIAQGLVALASVAAVLMWMLTGGAPETELRGTVFFALVGAILSLVLVNRSFSATLLAGFGRPNMALAVIAALAAAVLLIAEFLPAAGQLLGMTALGWTDGLVALGAGTAVLGTLQVAKHAKAKES
ncbi:cation-translocating P-type ATPase [Sphingomonas sp. BGYR3]|uniref:cation-translocating P-type ATPase n=1 Tax=Sphingomonas sp. BGYR3 TaxID=2975483 RepID=UPI0021A383C4|nr:cation-translocating P-type ATPase [Sphingomonas sp. BGYR3]MDG5488819.1 cation-translocating P-type ATPase [Sphingomonas sp. BGYR3]